MPKSYHLHILLIVNGDSPDYGCDPTWQGTDHTREHVPVLVYGKKLNAVALVQRDTFADMGKTLASFFNLEPMDYGTSFLPKLTGNLITRS
jgi:phosphopentomutase